MCDENERKEIEAEARAQRDAELRAGNIAALATLAALADMTGAYHAERKHDGRWSACQHPRCQNARLATEGRGPFADPFRARADTPSRTDRETLEGGE